MKLVITGLRPHKLLPDIPKDKAYEDYFHPLRKWVRQRIYNQLTALKPELVYTGMAQGVDTDTAFICKSLKIPYVAAVPFVNQELHWSDQDQQVYNFLLENALCVKVVSNGHACKYKYLKRNCYMVDCLEPGDHVLGVWDGSPGGTAHCLAYARKNSHNVTIINPKDYYLEAR
jgi:uncharacterized phage-like protein YoqJ